MSTSQELRKPTFVKVKDLEKVRSGYNVYVKVVTADIRDIQTRDGQKIRMVDAVVGDETGVAKAFFKGENATLIAKDSVIAIRNGLKKYIKNFISLELDIFGRVTKENVDITVDQSYNISQHEHKLPERGQRDPRGQRNFSQRRNYRNDRGPNNRQPRRDGDRPPRRDGDRPSRRDGDRPSRRQDDRPPRREQDRPRREDRPRRIEGEDRPRGERPARNDRGDRNFDRNDRPPRRDNNTSYDRDFDRRRDNNQRPPRRQQQRYEPRREEYRERAPVEWTKIDEISPGDERLNLIVKVIAEQLVQGRNRNMLRSTLGDETGVVRAFLQDSPALRVGKSVVLFDCQARVVKEHIELQCRGRIETARREVEKVNEKFNLSDKSWVPVNQ